MRERAVRISLIGAVNKKMIRNGDEQISMVDRGNKVDSTLSYK